MAWILIQQIAPTSGRYAGMPWAVGYLNLETGSIQSITWYYTEDEARLAHHRLLN
jgi:hypothetical protein